MKLLDLDYLDKIEPSYLAKGYSIPKWIQFSRALINHGWKVELLRSKTTVSKYVHVSYKNMRYKVRFSNHKANKLKEKIQDSDYYVGVSHNNVMTTESLIEILLKKSSNNHSN